MTKVAYEVAMASKEARHDREARRVYSSRFAIGQLVEKNSRNGRPLHGKVVHMSDAGPNQNISILMGSGTQLDYELAERWTTPTYSSRRRCTCSTCRPWNALSFWQRWSHRNQLELPADDVLVVA